MPPADVTIRYLELASPGGLRPRRSSSPDIRFARVTPPIPELNRFFYMAMGGPWFWLERREWSPSEWSEYVGSAAVETWVLSSAGVPAGYVELERLRSGDVELKYFGLLAAFTGRGLGAHLLTEAVERAWTMGASRVILNTCNLDHPRALANYLARGFREYRTEVKTKELPARAPGPWEATFAVSG